MNLFEQVQETIAQTLKVSPDAVTRTSTHEDVRGWDSLGHVNLMMALEQTFDVQLEVEDFPGLSSVPGILSYLKQHGIE